MNHRSLAHLLLLLLVVISVTIGFEPKVEAAPNLRPVLAHSHDIRSWKNLHLVQGPDRNFQRRLLRAQQKRREEQQRRSLKEQIRKQKEKTRELKRRALEATRQARKKAVSATERARGQITKGVTTLNRRIDKQLKRTRLRASIVSKSTKRLIKKERSLWKATGSLKNYRSNRRFGHIYSKHVSVTDSKMKERAKSSGTIITKFASEQIARKAISQAISKASRTGFGSFPAARKGGYKERRSLNEWANNSSDKSSYKISLKLPYNLGYGYTPDGRKITSINRIYVELRKDRAGKIYPYSSYPDTKSRDMLGIVR
jgi:hypothetical protein